MDLSLRRRDRLHGDEGVGIVVVLMVALLAMSLSLLVAQVAVRVGRDSGVDRQRTVAVSAAEAGVDAAVAGIASGGANPPCRWPASGTADVGSYPDTTTVSATITYSDAAGTALACVGAVSGTAATATITATASTQPLGGGTTRGVRTMKAVVGLTAPGGAYLNRAIFSDAALTMGPGMRVEALPGVSPDIYSNSDFVCDNSSGNPTRILSGKISAQGAVTLGRSGGTACSVKGDVYAKGSVSNTGSTQLGGNVTSSQGSVSLDGGTTVMGDISASGTTTAAPCPGSRCHPGSTTLADPPRESFPVLNWDTDSAARAAWTNAGYTNVVTKDNCSADPPGAWVVNNAGALPAKTVLVTHCPVTLSTPYPLTLTLNNDLAIIAYKGIVNNNVYGVASTGASSAFHWIVPADAATTRPCTDIPMSTGSVFNDSGDVNMLFYSPCDITLQLSSAVYGQIYSGSTIKQGSVLNLQYRPMALWGNSSAAPAAYSPTILRKYESK